MGFIDDEAWLVASGCYCWVEAGYSTYSLASTTVDYFWADDRPGFGYTEHDLGPMPAADFDHYGIYDIHDTGGNTFSISIVNQATNYSSSSINNSMTVGGIDEGQELYGTRGAAALYVLFIYNQFYNGIGTPYESTDGTVISNDPPFATWLIKPSASSNGADFSTECCLPL